LHTAEELRRAIIDTVGANGGHLASNLGAVELTLAVHKVYDPFRDRIIFDVGHQSYSHKLLTGRAEQFGALRKFGGLSGFTSPRESDADAFISGHASNSISLALGMAKARTLNGDDYAVCCIVGDGALTGGLAYEGLANAGQSGEALVVILNNNGMSISRNVGAIARVLGYAFSGLPYFKAKQRIKALLKKIPGGGTLYRAIHRFKEAAKGALLGGNIFEQLGFRVMGPIDGHNEKELEGFIRLAKSMDVPTLVHVVTQKGRGYAPAVANPGLYHGVSPFDVKTGIAESHAVSSFSESFGAALTSLAAEDKRVCAVTAAMEDGTGLSEFARLYPERFFDVGIAEGHAVTFAGGLAKQGLRPFVALYSTFLQRAFDNVIEDIAILNLTVTLCVDRAGLVPSDGVTHQGIFDVGFLTQIPNMTLAAPANYDELRTLLRESLSRDGPLAIRYPKGAESDVPLTMLTENASVTIVSYGAYSEEPFRALRILEKNGISADFIRLISLKPLDCGEIAKSLAKTDFLIVAEDSSANGSIGQQLVSKLAESGNSPKRVLLMNTGDRFIPQGTVAELRRELGLDAESIAENVGKALC
jgi:1-deoxy-D-xylulose-5-phosphate synthase